MHQVYNRLMSQTNQKIDQLLRRQLIRRLLTILVAVILFIGFMSYALYKEYGPGTEVVDYFPEVNDKGQ